MGIILGRAAQKLLKCFGGITRQGALFGQRVLGQLFLHCNATDPQVAGNLPDTVELPEVPSKNLLLGIHAYHRFYVAYPQGKQPV